MVESKFVLLLLLLVLGAQFSAPAVALPGEEGEEDVFNAVPEYNFTPEAQRDLVTNLPGARSLGKRRMYSGYIPVEGQGRGTLMG